MTFTITLDSLLKTILLILGIAAVIILIVLMVKVIKALKTLPNTMRNVDSIVDNVETLSTAGRDAVTKASAALTGIKQAADENRGPVRAATSLIAATTGLVALLKKDKEKK
ncbi:MAG: hypothetical protein J5535_01645 [Firmicutes bacterium]|nr:hypothetical protein [Bacillota bacterium]